MSNLNFRYCIRSDLPAHPESPTSIGAKFLITLDALSRIDPTIFCDWNITDLPAIESLPLAAARSCIATIIERNVSRDDLGEPDPDWGGYWALASTGHGLGPRRMSLRIAAGAKRDGATDLEAGEYDMLPDPAVVTYPVFKGALLAINAIWPPAWACAYALRMDYDKVPLCPGAALFPYSRFHIPWFAYLSAPLAVGIELPPEIMTERMPDGGLLMIATEERLEPTNPEHLRRTRILAETMIARTGYRSS
jgi:immunity protein 52 of polymorphic toxin system